jgi:hypothetical protein
LVNGVGTANRRFAVAASDKRLKSGAWTSMIKMVTGGAVQIIGVAT